MLRSVRRQLSLEEHHEDRFRGQLCRYREGRVDDLRLALASARRGHETWLTGVDDFTHRLDGTVAARARGASPGKHHAAFRRVNGTGDRRSNMRVGGTAERVNVTDAMLDVAEIVRPKLLADGMFLVGLDIVGDKLMEVNVFSPGGLGICESLYKARFSDAVIDALEQKVAVPQHYRAEMDNRTLATL